MKTSLLSPLLILVSCGLVLGDEQVRRAQEELRKRNLYFGEIDGRRSDETTGALRRYQQRKGFSATGELDTDTLASLQITPPPKDAPAWPDAPVLKSDAARQIAENDRKLLESLESADPETPPPVAEGPDPNAPPEPASVPETGADPSAKTVAQRAEAFVRDYLEACETNDLGAEIRFYSDRVKYFDHGTVSRDFIENDVRRYYKRWPNREFELLDFKLLKATANEMEVRFRIRFKYEAPQRPVTGKTENTFQIRMQGEEMKFVSMKERRVRD